MRLLTTAGRYAGEIREYSHQAGLAALKAGTATRLDAPAVPPVRQQAVPPSPAPEPAVRPRRRRF